MALPTLDATFASSADLPRKQMLAKWLVEELGSGSIADYYDLPERYLWAKIAVAAGGPKTEADYISLPKNYAWSDIYNAVSGDIAQSAVAVSGLGDSQYNGNYVYDGDYDGKPSYRLSLDVRIFWDISQWALFDSDSGNFSVSTSDVSYPWLATGWQNEGIDPTGLALTPQTPNHTDWSENVALGHIAAAYRGDTGNPANLATYIDWPWRYKVASIISHLAAPESYNAVIVSGAGTSSSNGTYEFSEIGESGKPTYLQNGTGNTINWVGFSWVIFNTDIGDDAYSSNSDTEFPWQATGWIVISGSNPVPTLTPINV